ncbi:endonuclease/exonuclease/phosphatase family protein [Herbaspirillum sp. SJZ107]|uniref:endonuclease/exonuclease/phosphatase family protein n=1 Tax=Herbaspirillum sp. SJZ107 TaxID=2572881 RepID=UPI00115299D8|nr:endonuclease/exonuclease/phosphatase family protein [Herbaspirillum sp. SJZ107]TQK11112.1 endonuclease/exonuclease/phosphatase family metal-dependent hydrolase [Herbaspirillum sp. SJZ107]
MIELITWNVQSARTAAGSADWQQVAAALGRFPDAAILCLQEVSSGFPARDGSSGGDGFAALATALPAWHAATAIALDVAGPDGGRRRLGCMTFSRFPVVQVLRHSLPWPLDAAVPSMPRSVLELTLDTPLGPLRVLNAHLEYFSEAQRLAQVDGLRRLQQEACAHAGAPRPGLDAGGPFAAISRARDAVLAGDFNMLPGSRSWQRLLAPFADGTPAWLDAWQLARPGQAHAPTVGIGSADPFTFDYAFVGAGLVPRVRSVRVDDAAVGSDHQPLLLTLG